MDSVMHSVFPVGLRDHRRTETPLLTRVHGRLKIHALKLFPNNYVLFSARCRADNFISTKFSLSKKFKSALMLVMYLLTGQPVAALNSKPLGEFGRWTERNRTGLACSRWRPFGAGCRTG